MPRRLALLALLLLALTPSLFRGVARLPDVPASCPPDGRGVPPRGWIGCAADAGPRRDLTGLEKVLSGVRLDVNSASAEDLAWVPGLSPRLAAALVDDRAGRGPFASLDDVLRVRGIGPARLAHARPHLDCASRPGR